MVARWIEGAGEKRGGKKRSKKKIPFPRQTLDLVKDRGGAVWSTRCAPLSISQPVEPHSSLRTLPPPPPHAEADITRDLFSRGISERLVREGGGGCDFPAISLRWIRTAREPSSLSWRRRRSRRRRKRKSTSDGRQYVTRPREEVINIEVSITRLANSSQ